MNETKAAIVIPTYNEAATIVPLIHEIFRYFPGIHIWVIDDNSPDGTAQKVIDSFRNCPLVTVVVRKGKRGRGLAGREGFLRAIQAGSDIVGEMDADFSHHPHFIPFLLAALGDSDVAIGSRYIAGGGEEKRGVLRSWVTGGARFYLRLFLGITLTDPTSGFRFFRREVLQKILPFLHASDPFIVTEVNFHLKRLRARMVEVPIYFYERQAGRSKLKLSILGRYLWRVLWLRMKWTGKKIKETTGNI
ncbi:MAG: polyprenol monophosphomannose synthase [Candidatus Omnitrophica bacterium]|nr:polyprenol monophosphomannose synthase [Candidatus Omnitrophota bacterium]